MSAELSTHYRAKRLSFSTLDSGEDGTLVLRDTVLLAAGEWHDSVTPYPTVYTPENLARFKIWDDQSVVAGYKEHGSQHSMDDEIGDAVNIHYDSDKQAIVCDLILHGATQASRDVIGIIRHNQKQHKPNYVSIEMMTRDVPGDNGKMMATDILVTGWIATTTPACKVCAIKQANATTMTEEQQNPDEKKNIEDKKEVPKRDPQSKETGNVGEAHPVPDVDPKTKPGEGERQVDLRERIGELEAKLNEILSLLNGGKELNEIKDLNRRITALETKPTGAVMHMQNESPVEPIVEYTTRYVF